MDRRKATLFLTCLGISLAAWLFSTLSGNYDYQTDTVVHYVNSPGTRAYHPLQPDTVTVTLRGTGWQMLFNKLRIGPDAITADVSSLKSRNFIVFSDQLSGMNEKMRLVNKIIAVDPDTLYFDFSRRSVKRVPVRLVTKFSFRNQFGVAADIVLQPAYVTITGPAADLTRLDSWPTDSLMLKDIHRDATARVPLSRLSTSVISVFPPSVNVTIPVDEFTEKELLLPLRVINAGNNQVKLLPGRVKVTFLSSLKRYHDPVWDRAAASVNLDEWRRNGSDQLAVKLVNVPPHTRVVKIDPQTIDFTVSN